MKKRYAKLNDPNKIKIKKNPLNSIIINNIEMPIIINNSVINIINGRANEYMKLLTSTLIFWISFDELIFK